jgi:hypothetical protein
VTFAAKELATNVNESGPSNRHVGWANDLTCKGWEVEMRTYLLESAARSLQRFYDSVDPAETDLRQQLCAIAIRLEQVRRKLSCPPAPHANRPVRQR